MQTGRFQPYVMARARLYEHRNAEAGPSTLMLPPTPYVDQRRSHPPGGISETTADAVTTNQITEEDRVTVSHFYCSHVPRVSEWLFGVRNPSGPDSPTVEEGRAPPA